jgi:undecaprenyl diphosphate synthase
MSKAPEKNKGFAEQKGLNPNFIPTHVAMIMDGNGRWAKKRFLPRTFGHREGIKTLEGAIETSVKLQVQYLTMYTFSTENWKRPKDEVDFLMSLLEQCLIDKAALFKKHKIRLRCLGDLQRLPQTLQAQIAKTELETSEYHTLHLNLMINYGGRDEIVHAVNHILKESHSEQITEEDITKNLFTTGMPEPDILVRTGGDFRLSNFLLWQSAYAELFFIDTLWPDFSESEYIDIIKSFQKRERRYGAIHP